MAKKIQGTSFEENKKYSELQASIAALKKKKGTSPEIDAELKRREAAAKKFQALYAAAVEKGYTQSLSTSTYAGLMKYVDSKNPSAKAGLSAYDASLEDDKPKEPLTPAEKKARGLGIAAGAIGAWAAIGAVVGAFGGGDLTAWAVTQAIPAIGSALGTAASAMFALSPTFAIGGLLAVGLAAPLIFRGVKKLVANLKERRRVVEIDRQAAANEKAFNSLMENAGSLSVEDIKGMSILTPEQKSKLLAERNKKDAEGKTKVERHAEKEKLKTMAVDYVKDGIDSHNAVDAHRALKTTEEYKDFAKENTTFILSDADRADYDKAVATKQDAEQKNTSGNFLGETDTNKTKIEIARAKAAGLDELNTGKDFLGETDDSKKKIDIARAMAEEAAKVETGKTKSNLELANDDLAAKIADEQAKKNDYDSAPLSSADRAAKRAAYLAAKHAREQAQQKVENYKNAQTYVSAYDYASEYDKAVPKTQKHYANATEIEVDGVSKTLHEHLADGPSEGQTKEEWIKEILRGVQKAGIDMETARKYINSYLAHETAIKTVETEENTFFVDDDGKRKLGVGSSEADMDGIIADCEKEKADSLALCMSDTFSGDSATVDKSLDILSKLTPEQLEELAKQKTAESTLGG